MTILLSPAIPMFFTFIAAILMLVGYRQHSINVRRMHFLGRFYLFLIYFAATLNIFTQQDTQAFVRAGITFLMLEEIVVWGIEIFYPTLKR